MHPRISLHQVAFINQPSQIRATTEFIEHCHAIGVENATLVSPLLDTPEQISEARQAVSDVPVKISAINHVFASDLEKDNGEATRQLQRTVETAHALGAKTIYLLTGARGTLDWESAAQRFAELISPCRNTASEKGIHLLVENASGFNADIHIAHTLDDTTLLAKLAGIGICIELHACWFEAGLKQKLSRAMPDTGLVQVSDYVLGDRTAPCRAVPGDGVIPLESIIGDILDLGYEGLFDAELVGPRIEQEGVHAATQRACEQLSEILVKFGV